MRIRLFAKDDLKAILALQGGTPQAAQWLEADYARLSSDPQGAILVAELENMDPPKVVGFASFQRVIDQAEFQNIAIDPQYRHQGLGNSLLEEAVRRLREAGAKRIYLEVRPSNKPALSLYTSIGFKLHSARKNYYRDPPEDAYVMSLDL